VVVGFDPLGAGVSELPGWSSLRWLLEDASL
jgi:hypothetical protein